MTAFVTGDQILDLEAVDPAAVQQAVEVEAVSWVFTEDSRTILGRLKGNWDLRSLVQRATHPDPRTRAKVAPLKSCPPELVTVLFRDPDPAVRAAAARSENLPVVLLDAVLTDRDPRVRMAAAANPDHQNNPVVIAALTADRDSKVRRSVAVKAGLDPATLSRMSQDADPHVRAAVAARRDCPKAVLWKLADDPDPAVRTQVAGHTRAGGNLIRRVLNGTTSEDVHRAVARNVACPPDVLSRLAHHESPLVRQSVASNPEASSEVLDGLGHDPQRLRSRHRRQEPDDRGWHLARRQRHRTGEHFRVAAMGSRTRRHRRSPELPARCSYCHEIGPSH